jgi:ribonuclease T2
LIAWWRLVLSGVLFLLVSPAMAQSQETKGGPAGQFDFYVLALSWSPGFCELSGDADRKPECEPGKGLNFVVHGLWPQNDQGYPTFCKPGARFPSRANLASVSGLYPDDGLARYEWRKHGTCSGENPDSYFRLVRQARERVRVPDSFTRTVDGTKAMPLEIERAFSEVNPGLRPEMMSVSCRQSLLQEVRVCLSRDLRNFQQCPEVDRDTCRAGQISIPAVR